MKRITILDTNKNSILKMYEEENKTVEEIASFFKVSISTISKRLKLWNKRNKDVGRFFRTDIEFNIITNLYLVDGLNIIEAAKVLGCGKSTVYRSLIKYNIPIKIKGKPGDKHPNWKGGVTPERAAFYNSIEWKKAAKEVWIRDGAKCRICENHRSKIFKLCIHHIIPFCESKESRCDVNNLVLLCKDCHYFVHSRRNEFNVFRGGIVDGI